MTGGTPAQIAVLVEQLREAWERAVQLSTAGDAAAADAALDDADKIIRELLAAAGPLAGEPEVARQLVAKLDQDAQALLRQVRAARDEAAAALRELGRQRQEVRTARAYLGRIPRQSRRLDENA